MTALGSKV